MALCTKIITCCAILHNLAIQSGDSSDDLQDHPQNVYNQTCLIESTNSEAEQRGGPARDKRQNEILAHFIRHANRL